MTDLLSDWRQVAGDDQLAIVKAIRTAVAAKLEPKPHYPGMMQDAPRVEVFAANRDGRKLTVHFVADHLMYCRTITGSDWAEHFVFVGTARFEHDRVVSVELTGEQVKHLSELEVDDYATERLVKACRDEAIARLRGR